MLLDWLKVADCQGSEDEETASAVKDCSYGFRNGTTAPVLLRNAVPLFHGVLIDGAITMPRRCWRLLSRLVVVTHRCLVLTTWWFVTKTRFAVCWVALIFLPHYFRLLRQATRLVTSVLTFRLSTSANVSAIERLYWAVIFKISSGDVLIVRTHVSVVFIGSGTVRKTKICLGTAVYGLFRIVQVSVVRIERQHLTTHTQLHFVRGSCSM